MLGAMPTGDEVRAGTGLPGNDYGEVLWEPSPDLIERARITDFRRWLSARGRVDLGGGHLGRGGRRGGGSGSRLPPALAVVGRASGRLLGFAVGLLRGAR